MYIFSGHADVRALPTVLAESPHTVTSRGTQAAALVVPDVHSSFARVFSAGENPEPVSRVSNQLGTASRRIDPARLL
jgi:hypothetical protein